MIEASSLSTNVGDVGSLTISTEGGTLEKNMMWGPLGAMLSLPRRVHCAIIEVDKEPKLPPEMMEYLVKSQDIRYVFMGHPRGVMKAGDQLNKYLQKTGTMLTTNCSVVDVHLLSDPPQWAKGKQQDDGPQE